MPLATDDKIELTGPPADPDNEVSAVVRWGVLALLAAVLLASLGVLTSRFLDGASGSPSAAKLGRVLVGRTTGAADTLASQREQVMSQATKFAVRLNTYGPQMLGPDHKTMPSYRKEVAALLTPKFQTDFNKNVPLAEATVASQGAGRSAEVYAAGVAAIDQDTATALVTGRMTFTYPQKPGSTKRVTAAQQLFRWEVDLVKTHGTWLVDNWAPAEQAPTTGGSGVAQ